MTIIFGLVLDSSHTFGFVSSGFFKCEHLFASIIKKTSSLLKIQSTIYKLLFYCVNTLSKIFAINKLYCHFTGSYNRREIYLLETKQNMSLDRYQLLVIFTGYPLSKKTQRYKIKQLLVTFIRMRERLLLGWQQAV